MELGRQELYYRLSSDPIHGYEAEIQSGTEFRLGPARMGVELFWQAIDCFFTGSAEQVRECCAEVKLVVR